MEKDIPNSAAILIKKIVEKCGEKHVDWAVNLKLLLLIH